MKPGPQNSELGSQMSFEITAHSVHSWGWPLHTGTCLTLLNPDIPFLKGHRMAIVFSVRLEALHGPFWSGVGLSQQAGPLATFQPHINQNPLSTIIYFGIQHFI